MSGIASEQDGEKAGFQRPVGFVLDEQPFDGVKQSARRSRSARHCHSEDLRTPWTTARVTRVTLTIRIFGRWTARVYEWAYVPVT